MHNQHKTQKKTLISNLTYIYGINSKIVFVPSLYVNNKTGQKILLPFGRNLTVLYKVQTQGH